MKPFRDKRVKKPQVGFEIIFFSVYEDEAADGLMGDYGDSDPLHPSGSKFKPYMNFLGT